MGTPKSPFVTPFDAPAPDPATRQLIPNLFSRFRVWPLKGQAEFLFVSPDWCRGSWFCEPPATNQEESEWPGGGAN